MRTIEEILEILDIKENIKDKKMNKAKIRKIKREFQEILEKEGYEIINIDWDFNTNEVYVSIISSPQIPYDYNEENIIINFYESW